MVSILSKVIIDYIRRIKKKVYILDCMCSRIISKKYKKIKILKPSLVKKPLNILLVVTSNIFRGFFTRKISKIINEEKIALELSKNVIIFTTSISENSLVNIPINSINYMKENIQKTFKRKGVIVNNQKGKKEIVMKNTNYNEIISDIAKIPSITKNGLFKVKRKYKVIVTNKEEVNE
ncbi:hypothetical protein ACWNYH_00110 [Candidatus Vidania fulgoroideorum]